MLKGVREDFAHLIDVYRPTVFNLAFRLTGRSGEADDFVFNRQTAVLAVGDEMMRSEESPGLPEDPFPKLPVDLQEATLLKYQHDPDSARGVCMTGAAVGASHSYLSAGLPL